MQSFKGEDSTDYFCNEKIRSKRQIFSLDSQNTLQGTSSRNFLSKWIWQLNISLPLLHKKGLIANPCHKRSWIHASSRGKYFSIGIKGDRRCNGVSDPRYPILSFLRRPAKGPVTRFEPIGYKPASHKQSEAYATASQPLQIKFNFFQQNFFFKYIFRTADFPRHAVNFLWLKNALDRTCAVLTLFCWWLFFKPWHI